MKFLWYPERNFFHGSRDLVEFPLQISSASPHNETPQSYFLRTAFAAPLIPRRQKACLCYHIYRYSSGILTGFPFGTLELPRALGPTNPQLTNIAEESVLYKVSRILIWISCY